jgi:hypothetical protein
MKKLYPIFVNFNSGKQLYEGVTAVLKSPSVTGIIVVDNGSIDQSMNHLSQIKNMSRVIIIKNKKNLGFYKALNIAIRKAFELKADMVMPLDFDLDFSFDFITKLSKVDGDIIAPVLKFKKDGKWFYDYGGKFNFITGSSNHIIKNYPTKNLGAVKAARNRRNPNSYDFVSGGCTIIKKEVIEKNGYFDEDYFVYWGDADYIVKAGNAGFKVVMDGNTIVYHKIEIARQTRNFKKLKISFFDNLMFIKKRIRWYFKPIAYLHIFLLSTKVFLVTLKSLFNQA